jgi:dolichyl-phosphate beta-glucosyltransferase
LTSLVLPAFNPGAAIEQTWIAVCRFLAARTDSWEVLFVLDGCTDGTSDRLARLAENSAAPIRILSYARNQGKGYAVRTGLLAARGSVRLFTDIDLAYSFDDVLRVASSVRAGSSVVIASRAHRDSWIQLPAATIGYAFRRVVQGKVFGTIARCLLPISQRDTQAGLKGMTAEVAEAILPHLSCNGFGFDCELLTACARSGIQVTEVPVCVRYDGAVSTTSAGSGLKMLRELWRIRNAWRNRSVKVVRVPLTPNKDAVPARQAA